MTSHDAQRNRIYKSDYTNMAYPQNGGLNTPVFLPRTMNRATNNLLTAESGFESGLYAIDNMLPMTVGRNVATPTSQ